MRSAVCLYVRDEARDIAEWVFYYLDIGFDDLFVYDNGSVDGTRDVLESLRAAGNPVLTIPWPFSDRHAQYTAYDHCLFWTRATHDWVAFLDIDEFLVLHSGLTLSELLSDRRDCDAMAVHWAFFGSSGHEDFPNELTIEAFQRRAPDSFGPSRHVKSIVRPDGAIKAISPHVFEVKRNYELASRAPVAWASTGITASAPDYTVCQLNHYFVRSAAHWSAKLARGYRDGERSASEFVAYDRNEVEDRSAGQYAASVKARMQASAQTAKRVTYPDRLFQFDPFYYNLVYQDVRASGIDPAKHFWTHGVYEDRNPNPWIDSVWYKSEHMQAVTEHTPAYIDFLNSGARLRHRTRPD